MVAAEVGMDAVADARADSGASSSRHKPMVLVLNKSDLLSGPIAQALEELCDCESDSGCGSSRTSKQLLASLRADGAQSKDEGGEGSGRLSRLGRLVGVWLVSSESKLGQERYLSSMRTLVERHFHGAHDHEHNHEHEHNDERDGHSDDTIIDAQAAPMSGDEVCFSRERHRQHLRRCVEALDRFLVHAAPGAPTAETAETSQPQLSPQPGYGSRPGRARRGAARGCG